MSAFVWRYAWVFPSRESQRRLASQSPDMRCGDARYESLTDMRTLWCVAGRGMTDVGTLGGKHSQALGISPDGRVVGASTRVKTGPAIYYAFVWDRGDLCQRLSGDTHGCLPSRETQRRLASQSPDMRCGEARYASPTELTTLRLLSLAAAGWRHR